MSELYEKSIRKLELPLVLEKLSEQATSLDAKERCRSLQPLTDAEEIRILQQQTTAACKLVELKGTPGFNGIIDVRPIADRAHRGGCLNPSELLQVAGVLRCARNVKSYCDGDYMESILDPLFFTLSTNRYLEEQITAAILSEDEIADGASSELATIRRHMRIQSAKIKESLQKIISSSAYSKALQEPIVTMRSDRYVVPVKAEFKNAVPGLIHDVSSSGSTYFIEPNSAVEANNKLRELAIEEQREIERILAAFSRDVASHREQIATNFQILVQLDEIFARARYSFVIHGMEPQIRTDGVIELKRARHPLIDPKTVVPVSVRLGSDFDTLIITGPNTGGKTVTLKTLGLLTLMAECGLHIPADSESCVSVYQSVLADIGDEQSIEQSLSTFSAHMKNIVEITQQCDENALILFDELGAGTDPAEGAALAISLIEFCRNAGSRVAATTHYAELKIYAMRTKGVVNAACEFDVETLRPTYKLLIGVPGKSNAFAISRRLGLSEDILKKAKDTVSENDQNFEEVLSQLEQQRQKMEAARIEMERLKQETEQQKQKSDQYYAEIQREREKAVEKARAEANYIIDEARATANAVQEELKQLRKHMLAGADLTGYNAKQAEMRRKLNEAQDKLVEKKQVEERPAPSRDPKVGDTVELLKLGTKATVLACNKDGTYRLQAGIMQINAKKEEIYLLENYNKPVIKQKPQHSGRQMRTDAAPAELDLRGMDCIEAVTVLEQYLDRAMMSKQRTIRIIHGKGTGALRSAVQAELKRSRIVKSYRLGMYGEGESGVTIAELNV